MSGAPDRDGTPASLGGALDSGVRFRAGRTASAPASAPFDRPLRRQQHGPERPGGEPLPAELRFGVARFLDGIEAWGAAGPRRSGRETDWHGA